jgi:hypothetical protein
MKTDNSLDQSISSVRSLFPELQEITDLFAEVSEGEKDYAGNKFSAEYWRRVFLAIRPRET